MENMSDPTVLYVTPEAVPFAVSGGLGEVASSLPRALRARETDIRVVMPLYRAVDARYRAKMTKLCEFSVPVAWRQEYCGVHTAVHGGVTFYFLDNERYFGRDSLYGCCDDGERFAFFGRAVCEMLWRIPFFPDILHANDWQSALSIIYYRQFYRDRPGYGGIRTLYTIHNIEYQGVYAKELYTDLFGLESSLCGDLWYRGDLNLTKGAVVCADRVSTVSPRYAREICTPGYSEGLCGILEKYKGKLSGILNGIDTSLYDPAADPALPVHYTPSDLEGKAYNKACLQQELGLPVSPDSFLIIVVSRLVAHKGLDLVACVIREVLGADVQLAVLGTGDPRYEQFLGDLCGQYPDQVRTVLRYDGLLARRMYAGGDLLLMPSRAEPCGLSQMIASRYGTVPLVRETGGLADTVRPYLRETGEGNGFTFANYNAHDMLHVIWQALGVYLYDREKWNALVRKIMEIDFSWKRAAERYAALYRETAGR